MNRSIKLVGAAALALGLAGVGVAAQEGPGFGEGPRRGMHGRHGYGRELNELNLTDAQKEQLKAMRQQQHEAMRPLMERQRELRQQIHEALEAGNADATRIGQLEIQSHQLRQQMKAQREKAEAAFVNVLTPEQKAQWEKMRAERKERRENFREEREERFEQRQQREN